MYRRLGFMNLYVVNPMRVSARKMVVMWLFGVHFDRIFDNEVTIDLELTNMCRFTFLYGLHDMRMNALLSRRGGVIFLGLWLGISMECYMLMKKKDKGCFFTGRNVHDEDFIQERLDLVLAIEAALGKFPDMEVFVPPNTNTGSDHNMLVLSLDVKGFFRY